MHFMCDELLIMKSDIKSSIMSAKNLHYNCGLSSALYFNLASYIYIFREIAQRYNIVAA
jgi:hypothetical protein